MDNGAPMFQVTNEDLDEALATMPEEHKTAAWHASQESWFKDALEATVSYLDMELGEGGRDAVVEFVKVFLAPLKEWMWDLENRVRELEGRENAVPLEELVEEVALRRMEARMDALLQSEEAARA